MSNPTQVKAAFETSQTHLRWVSRYLMGSPEAADEPQMRLVSALLDVASGVLTQWQRVCRVSGTPAAGAERGAASALAGDLFRAGRLLPVNIEGTRAEYHVLGAATSLDALIRLLEQTAGTGARNAAIVRKEAASVGQSAMHRYALAMHAPDTAVRAARSDPNFDGRNELVRRLHRAVVDLAAGVAAWAP